MRNDDGNEAIEHDIPSLLDDSLLTSCGVDVNLHGI